VVAGSKDVPAPGSLGGSSLVDESYGKGADRGEWFEAETAMRAEGALALDERRPHLRVLMVAPTPFFGDRGCHVRIFEQVRALRRHGAHVLVATYPVGRNVPEVTTVRTPRLPWVRRLPIGFSVHKPYLDLLLLVTAARALRRFAPDIIHGHLHEGGVLATVLGRISGVPAVADLQGSLTSELVDHGTLPATGVLPHLSRLVERRLLPAPADCSRPPCTLPMSFASSGAAAAGSRPCPMASIPRSSDRGSQRRTFAGRWDSRASAWSSFWESSPGIRASTTS
jgi:hypothetical protein